MIAKPVTLLGVGLTCAALGAGCGGGSSSSTTSTSASAGGSASGISSPLASTTPSKPTGTIIKPSAAATEPGIIQAVASCKQRIHGVPTKGIPEYVYESLEGVCVKDANVGLPRVLKATVNLCLDAIYNDPDLRKLTNAARLHLLEYCRQPATSTP